MSLKEQIDKSIKEAMLQKKKNELQALRSIKSMILLAETKEGADGEIGKEEEISIHILGVVHTLETAKVVFLPTSNLFEEIILKMVDFIL